MTVRMLTGDCRAMLATLPDASVQMVCTSPPYFGLRDYGTASWQGGDAACDHKHETAHQKQGTTSQRNGRTNVEDQRNENFRATCGKCGATRVDQQIGLEPTVEAYVAQLVAVFREVRRVLRDDGVLFLNLGDSYASHDPGGYREGEFLNPGGRPPTKQGSHRNRAGTYRPDGLKKKDLIGIPWRVAFALQQPWLTCRGCGTENHLSQWASFPNGRRICPACGLSKGHDISESGWWLRSEIIWHKPNPMPESVRDRPTKSHEQIFLLTKSPRYFWDAEAVKEVASEPAPRFDWSERKERGEAMRRGAEPTPMRHSGGIGGNGTGRNIRSVWTIATKPFSGSHFAVFPDSLAERCIKAGTSEKGACRACGAPWVRVVEQGPPCPEPEHRNPSKRLEPGQAGNVGAGNMGFRASRLSGQEMAAWRAENPNRTTGWQPTCRCGFDSIVPIAPCVVLDPFGGAGTVSLVAERLGRDSIYIDLSSDYAAMARKRVTGDAPMLAAVQST